MGKWNSYAVIVTQGVSNPNDRLGFKEKHFYSLVCINPVLAECKESAGMIVP